MKRGSLFHGVVLISMIALAGCATLSEEECRYADWHDLGFQDGRQGHPDNRVARHAEACTEYGIRPDADQWRDGWREGITYFCTPDRGWREGVDGNAYNQVCPPDLEPDFLYGYEPGRDLHRNRQSLQEVDQRIVEVEDELDADETMSSERRRELSRELRELQNEARTLERERGVLEAEASGRGLR